MGRFEALRHGVGVNARCDKRTQPVHKHLDLDLLRALLEELGHGGGIVVVVEYVGSQVNGFLGVHDRIDEAWKEAVAINEQPDPSFSGARAR